MHERGNGRVLEKERRLPVFRFNKAVGIARDLKVFLSLHSGVTRGEVPDLGGGHNKKQVEKLRNSRRLDREKIKNQAETLRYAHQHMGSLTEEIESKKREIFRLKNELYAVLEQVDGRFHLAGAEDIPLDDGSADVGGTLAVLHHVPDTETGIKSCVAKLKKGAFPALSVLQV